MNAMVSAFPPILAAVVRRIVTSFMRLIRKNASGMVC